MRAFRHHSMSQTAELMFVMDLLY